MRISSLSAGPGEDVAEGSATKEPPELELAFVAERLGAATKTPLAIAWARCIVSQAVVLAGSALRFSSGSQPMAVG